MLSHSLTRSFDGTSGKAPSTRLFVPCGIHAEEYYWAELSFVARRTQEDKKRAERGG